MKRLLLVALSLLCFSGGQAQDHDFVRDRTDTRHVTWGTGNVPILSILSGANGVDQLNPNLTINGTTVTPMFRYKGGDADGTDWNEWGYGSTLALQAGTVPSYNQGSPLLGPNDDSVKFNAGGYYKDSGSTVGDVATEDMVFEMIVKVGFSSAAARISAKRDLGSPYPGWYIIAGTSGAIALNLDAGVTSVNVTTNALSVDQWYHVMFFVNRDENSGNGAIAYVNAISSGGGANLSGAAGTLTNTNGLVIGAARNGTDPSAYTVAYFSGWKYADWHQAGAAGPAEWAVIAKERFLKLTGFWSPKGTVTYSRATEAVLSKREGSATKLYTVGDGWPRMNKVVDSASAEMIGYRSETADINELLYSEDFDDASWVKTRTTVDSDALLAPNKELTADGLVGDAVSNTHYIEQAIASTATEHIFAVFAKAGDQDWLYLEAPTVANANAYYDLSTCALGTVGIGATVYIEDYGDGWCRAILIYTGGAPSHAHRINSAEADTDHTFTGDGTTVNTWIWGATHSDEGLGYPTSYIKTEASTVTRVKDDLEITALAEIDNKARFTFNGLTPSYNPAVGRVFVTYSDGGGTADYVLMSEHPTGDVFRGLVVEASTSRTDDRGSTDIIDGTIHALSYKFEAGASTLKVDGLVEDTGTPVATPDDLDTLDIGQDNTAASQLNGVIGQVKIYKR